MKQKQKSTNKTSDLRAPFHGCWQRDQATAKGREIREKSEERETKWEKIRREIIATFINDERRVKKIDDI